MREKRKYFQILLLPIFLLLAGCNNEIELFRPEQEKTYVVFGLLNSTDPLQEVKIRMTSVTNAAITEISLDSSEFLAPGKLNVIIQEWQQNTYASYPLVPALFDKAPGIFFNTRNDVYETRFTPFIDMTYKLIISNPENGDLIESKIVPIPVPKLGAPTWSWIRHTFSNEADPFNIRFYEVPRTYIYLARFNIRYVEFYTDGDTVFRNAAWAFPPRYSDDPPEYSPIRNIQGIEYNQHMTQSYTYRVFQQLIPDREGLDYRQLICFEISVWGGDQNLRNYTEFGIKFNDNRKQVFTNINNGIGFFGACSHADCTGVLPDQDFMDSLLLDPRTAHLKFRASLYPVDHAPVLPDGDFLSVLQEIRKDE